MYIIINSLIYILTNSFSVLGIKLNNYLFNYYNFYISSFFLNIFYPIVILFYFILYKNFNNISFSLFKISLLCSFLFLIENILIYYSINNTPLNIYVISRTSISIFNLFFKKFYLKNSISLYNFIAVLSLLFSYLFLIIDIFYYNIDNNNNNNENNKNIIFFIILLISSFITSLYSNIYEKNFKELHNQELLGSKIFMKYKIFSYLIFNLLSFLVLLPISLFHIKSISNNININIIFIITGLCSQLFNIIRILLLTINNIDGNKLVAGLDLLRRVIMNFISYMYFDEKFNSIVFISNVLMFFGCVLLLLKK